MKKLEALMVKMFDLGVQVPLLVNAHGMAYPPNEATLQSLYGQAEGILPPRSVDLPKMTEFPTVKYYVCSNSKLEHVRTKIFQTSDFLSIFC